MIDEKRLSEIEKSLALNQMDRVAKRLNELDAEMRELRLSYWRYQAEAYPAYECHHPDTHFCSNCFDEARTDHD